MNGLTERPPQADEREREEALKHAFAPEVIALNADYPYWDKVKHRTTAIAPRILWQALKLQRSLGRTSLHFGRYAFGYTKTDEMLGLLHAFDRHIGGSLSGDDNDLLSNNRREYFLISSMMEEAIASSQMEGASTTRRVAKEMLRKNERPRDRSQQMIHNNYRTIAYLKEHASEAFSIERLQEIHSLMTEGTLDNASDAGRLRDRDDILVMDGLSGDVAHYPPTHSEIPALLADLEGFFNSDNEHADDEGTFIHPIVRACIIHFMLAYIHPFVDGNGRTARALFYWYMMRRGYWLIEYLSISSIIYKAKRGYERAFLYTECDDNDLTYFILYHLRTIRLAFDRLKNYLRRKAAESSHAHRLMSVTDINSRQAQMLQILREKPSTMFTVREIEQRFAVTNATARTDLRGLVERGFLAEVPMNKVKRGYVRSADFDQLLQEGSH
ncbi:hypothetical protein BHU09_04275 [Tannerella sp. oral taxon 808]|nr:hypothetical protein BHU09_04275 [Tannerella sp. oral taxon 808]